MKFKGFKISNNLPDVDAPVLSVYEFYHADHLSMFRKEEILNGSDQSKTLNFYHPIIVVLGGYFLYDLRKRKQVSGDYTYLKLIMRKLFIAEYIKSYI